MTLLRTFLPAALFSTLALGAAAAPASADAKGQSGPKTAPKKPQSLDALLAEPEKPEPPADEAPAAPAPATQAAAQAKPATKPAPAAPAPPAAPVQPETPATDDNDATDEAARPEALHAVQATGQPRRRGPYELGKLDCRVLDGAGIERVLPKRVVAGEEPDLLCRILVSQPPNVASEPHSVTMTVTVGEKETFREARKVRMSSIGRRALVFIVPADRIASYDQVEVTLRASLSAPAIPGGGQAMKFIVEPLD